MKNTDDKTYFTPALHVSIAADGLSKADKAKFQQELAKAIANCAETMQWLNSTKQEIHIRARIDTI